MRAILFNRDPRRVERARRSRYLIACVALLALECGAQAESWDNVTAISPRTEVRVTGARAGKVRGTLQSVTGDSLVLNSSAGQQSFDRQQITRVSVRKQGRRARNTLIGLGVGAGAGLGVGVASDQSCSPNGCLFGKNFGKAAFTPVGAGLGALVGALIPAGGWREIYKQ